MSGPCGGPPPLPVVERAPASAGGPSRSGGASRSGGQGLLGAVAAFGLSGAPALRARVDTPLEDGAWEALLGAARGERLTGALVAAVEAGAFPVSPSQEAELFETHLEAVCRVLSLERTLLEVCARFQAAGIDHRVLKGAAVAHLDYVPSSMRTYADVDLLVRGDQLDAAIALLGGEGWERQYPEPRPGFTGRFGKGMSLVRDGGPEIDLHRVLADGPFGQRVEPELLFAGGERFVLGGRELRGLGRTERLLHACYHACLGGVPARLWTLRDVAQLGSAPDLDADAVVALAARWGAQIVVARAVRSAWAVLGLEVEPGAEPGLLVWAQSYRATSREERWLAPYLVAGWYPGQAVAAVAGIRGARAKLAYVAGLAFPQRSYVAGRDTSRVARWRRGARVFGQGWRLRPVAGSGGEESRVE